MPGCFSLVELDLKKYTFKFKFFLARFFRQFLEGACVSLLAITKRWVQGGEVGVGREKKTFPGEDTRLQAHRWS